MLSRYRDVFTESVLKICNVGPEDRGDYLCTASSGIVSASATRATTLTVVYDEGIRMILNNSTAAWLQNLVPV